MTFPDHSALKEFLDSKVLQYNQAAFIHDDPICIPHSYTKRQDIEIAGFWAATLAWGQRKTTIKKCRALLAMMDYAPHDFILSHQPRDLEPLLQFKHRTFTVVDTLYFVRFLQHYYRHHATLEDAFLQGILPQDTTVANGITYFQKLFFSLENAPARTRKHVATPERKSACKRINMFLRWMVRKDEHGVDFGLWQRIRPQQPICPCDVHVSRVARKLRLMSRKNTDWQAALELTDCLRAVCPMDPVQYDFALFGLGIVEDF
ncbi:MAG: TIGR02757 family protein [Bacteroidota bacterium]